MGFLEIGSWLEVQHIFFLLSLSEGQGRTDQKDHKRLNQMKSQFFKRVRVDGGKNQKQRGEENNKRSENRSPDTRL
jgi:hypothetical protein